MIQSQAGFVLKRFQPNKSKSTILSMHEGKFDLSFRKFNDCFKLWPGMLVSFNVEKAYKTTFGSNVQILATPNLSEKQSIFFMHHILELCYFFVPSNKPCPEIFNFLKHFFLFFDQEIATPKYLNFTHKIFVTKLFSLFGFFSHDPISRYLAIHETLTTTFVDFSTEQKVEFLEKHLSLAQEKDFDEWILESLKIHPHSHLFKTTLFVYKQ